MGLLSELGSTLDFQESQQFHDKLQKDGVIQFINLVKKYEDYDLEKLHNTLKQQKFSPICPTIYWGDQIESHIIEFNNQQRHVKVYSKANEFIQFVNHEPIKPSSIIPQFGTWMIETSPNNPYTTLCEFSAVVQNIRDRTKFIQEVLHKSFSQNLHNIMIPAFPLLGVGDFHTPFSQTQNLSNGHSNGHSGNGLKEEEKLNQTGGKEQQLQNIFTLSQFIDDRLSNPHPRFPTLAHNIRMRRQSQVEILVPLFKDKNTNLEEQTKMEPFPGFAYMDAMAFGMGCCSIQTTFSPQNYTHARWVHDQFAVLAPIFMCISAGSPIFKGKLVDTDTRWDVIAQSVDDRTPQQRDPQNQLYIQKSRYDSISFFISDDPRNLPQYNERKSNHFRINEEIKAFAIEKGQEMGVKIDENMARHLGFLFLRDPLVIFDGKIDLENDQTTVHFENIQSTNWNSVRLQPPPSLNSEIGWRTEFRSMEVQLTSDWNSAFALLTYLFVRIFFQDSATKANLYIPIELVDINFERAKKRNAIIEQKFYFRINCQDPGQPQIHELFCHEILFGKEQIQFAGIINLSNKICQSRSLEGCCSKAKCYDKQKEMDVVQSTFKFFKELTTGKKITLASYIRQFVSEHKQYQFDSNISESIQYDLLQRLIKISNGELKDENFDPIYNI